MPPAWNAWCHATAHVYGSWCRGDPRGRRWRHHREHVEGDCRHPPPKGADDRLHARSPSLMKRNPVRVERDPRRFIVDAVVDKLRSDHIAVAIASTDARHVRVLARFPDHDVRHWLGRAKKHATHLLRRSSLRTAPGRPPGQTHPRHTDHG